MTGTSNSRHAVRARSAIRSPMVIVVSSLLGLAAAGGVAWAAAGDTQVVSVARSGTGSAGAHTSDPPAVNANGRYVLYGKRYTQVLLRDRWARTTEWSTWPTQAACRTT